MAAAKAALAEAVTLPARFPAYFASRRVRPWSAVLLYGPPGTGKTLAARALAAATAAPFLAVNAAAVLSPYIGEAEAGVRRVFRACRSAAPAVLFLDEVDALAPARAGGAAADDGSGVSGRVVSTLLTEMDAAAGVFVVAATNRPDLVDPALLVPGRLGGRVYVGLPAGAAAVAGVLAAAARDVVLGGDVDLGVLGGELADRGLSGADLAGVVKAAWAAAAERLVAAAGDDDGDGDGGRVDGEADAGEDADWWDEGGHDDGDGWLWAADEGEAAAGGGGDGRGGDGSDRRGAARGGVTVTMADLRAAAAAVTPSLSPEVLAGYDRLRRQYEGDGEAGGGARAAP